MQLSKHGGAGRRSPDTTLMEPQSRFFNPLSGCRKFLHRHAARSTGFEHKVFIMDPMEGIEMNTVRKVPMECSRCGSNRVHLEDSPADDDIVSCAECDEFLGVWFMLRDRLEVSARKRAAIDPALMAQKVVQQLDASA
ncbi:hypothetical protein R1T44_03920 [Cobetia amphilecti]|nr:hypothetical protein [Cobetia amphilecti]WOI26545.1 hypothetical protein R1T44_03920 [Cobetia amphilecti]